MGIWTFFLRAFYVQQCKRYPFLFSASKDINDFYRCSFIKNFPLFCPPLPVSSKLRYIPLVLTKAETTSDTFLQVFLINIYLIIIIENWIVTLLVKITCNFIKKMYNMKLIVAVPYVKIFFNNFLHFSNSCDVKLKSVLLIALFLFHWVLVSCICPNISFLSLLFLHG